MECGTKQSEAGVGGPVGAGLRGWGLFPRQWEPLKVVESRTDIIRAAFKSRRVLIT